MSQLKGIGEQSILDEAHAAAQYYFDRFYYEPETEVIKKMLELMTLKLVQYSVLEHHLNTKPKLEEAMLSALDEVYWFARNQMYKVEDDSAEAVNGNSNTQES
jgi:hypothetical protein